MILCCNAQKDILVSCIIVRSCIVVD